MDRAQSYQAFRAAPGEGEPLPLMEYALTELFEQRDGSLLTLRSYRASGGVQGALGRRSEEIYARLTPAEKEEARRLFGRLV